MNFEIVSLDSFYLNGVNKIFQQETMQDIPVTWDALADDLTLDELQQLNDFKALNGFIGACIKSEPMQALNYLISTASTSAHEQFDSIHIPASQWVIFEAVGPIPTAIQETFEYIYGTWFQEHDYEPLQTADLEFYAYDMDDEHPIVKIYIPIQPINEVR